MGKYKFIFILLILGIMIGINVAEKGIFSVNGTDESEAESFNIAESDGKVKVTVLGENFDTNIPSKSELKDEETDLAEGKNIIDEAEKSKIEEEENNPSTSVEEENVNNNVISNVGNKIGDMLQAGTEKGLILISKLVID